MTREELDGVESEWGEHNAHRERTGEREGSRPQEPSLRKSSRLALANRLMRRRMARKLLLGRSVARVGVVANVTRVCRLSGKVVEVLRVFEVAVREDKVIGRLTVLSCANYEACQLAIGGVVSLE